MSMALHLVCLTNVSDISKCLNCPVKNKACKVIRAYAPDFLNDSETFHGIVSQTGNADELDVRLYSASNEIRSAREGFSVRKASERKDFDNDEAYSNVRRKYEESGNAAMGGLVYH